MSYFIIGTNDLYNSLIKWRLWLYMGSLEVRQKYRRTLIGPFWITLALALFIGSSSFIYSVIFSQDLSSYMPYVAAGYISWAFISGYIGEACNVFIQNENFIRQLKLPSMIYPLKLLWRMLLTFFHHFIVLFITLVFLSGINLEGLIFATLGLLTNCVAILSIGTVLGFISVKNRDVPVLVTSIFQILFLITPIIWPVSAVGKRIEIAMFNPFYHMIELIRAPLLHGYTHAWLDHLTVVSIIASLAFLALLITVGSEKDKLNYYL